jgi:hypothetical protein
VKRLAGKPFALLGINSDADREALKKTNKKEQITWRSWWDNGSKFGPIQTKWQVEQRPVVYILDAKGVVRYKRLVSVDGEDLGEVVDSLLEELAAKPRKP